MIENLNGEMIEFVMIEMSGTVVTIVFYQILSTNLISHPIRKGYTLSGSKQKSFCPRVYRLKIQI
ncbi:MAG: hypothetical protein R6U04_13875 [Bacteroidales bacterium]